MSTLHITYLEMYKCIYNFISVIFQVWTIFNFLTEEKFTRKQFVSLFKKI